MNRLILAVSVSAAMAGPALASDEPSVTEVSASAPAASSSLAQTGPANEFRRWIVRGGVAFLSWDEDAEVTVGGAVVPGGNARLKDNTGIAFEGAYYFSPNVSVALALGVPPTTTLTASGSLEGAGELGDVTYGPAVLSARYHFTNFGSFVPYVGAGVNYTLIFDTEDKLLQNFKADDTVGPVLIAGADYALNDRWGLYFDAKKIWTSSDTSFGLPTPAGVAPGTAKVQLDPLVLNMGVSYRF